MTEREMTGLFGLVAEWAERLAGEVPVVRVEFEPGKRFVFRVLNQNSRFKWRRADGFTWTEDGQPAAGIRNGEGQ